MTATAFFEAEFFVLLLSSFIAPFCINACLMWKKTISRRSVMLFGFILVAISGINIFLLQVLKTRARTSSLLLDEGFFVSEISVAPYLVPAVFAGIGVNLISHGLITHLADAEKKLERI